MGLKKSGPDDLEKATNAGVVGLTALATTVNPALGVAFGMAAALFGPAIERRRQRAEELVRFIDERLSEFSNDVFEDSAFQDGFFFLLEKHIRERNDERRQILQQILLGYAKANELLDYPLEEMADLITRIRMCELGKANV